jgi:hypothetical protein
VDYIIIIIADVDVDVNPNEVRDTRYVSPEELKEMFKQPGTPSTCWTFLMIRPSIHAVVQTDLSTIFVQVVGESRQFGKVLGSKGSHSSHALRLIRMHRMRREWDV